MAFINSEHVYMSMFIVVNISSCCPSDGCQVVSQRLQLLDQQWQLCGRGLSLPQSLGQHPNCAALLDWRRNQQNHTISLRNLALHYTTFPVVRSEMFRWCRPKWRFEVKTWIHPGQETGWGVIHRCGGNKYDCVNMVAHPKSRRWVTRLAVAKR